MNSSRGSKLWNSFIDTIEEIKKGKKCIIFSPDYVLLSRNAYEAIIDQHHPEIKEIQYDEFKMHSWIENAFLKYREEKK